LTTSTPLIVLKKQGNPKVCQKIQVYKGTDWKYLELFGSIWNYLEVFGTIWNYLEVFGTDI
jgi:hypothetical protein